MLGNVLTNNGPKYKSVKWLFSAPFSEVVLAIYSQPVTVYQMITFSIIILYYFKLFCHLNYYIIYVY